jgi:hypothetical protein
LKNILLILLILSKVRGSARPNCIVTLKALRRGWCLGSDGFKRQMLLRMEGSLGEHHSGRLHREAADARAERIGAEELSRRDRREPRSGP